METLVDELCMKLRDLEGGGSDEKEEEFKKSNDENKTNLESLTPRDRALRYYAAFPALQPTTLKKFSQKKDRNFGNNNNNNNNKINGVNYNNNKNTNKSRNKKTKMSIVSIYIIIFNLNIALYYRRKFLNEPICFSAEY